MAYVTPREGENPESLVNRFRASSIPEFSGS